MWQRIVAFFTTLITLILSWFGINLGKVQTYRNVAYGTAARQVMDVYYPDKPENIEGSVDAMLFIHGGAWSSGDKSVYASYCKKVAENGYVAATMNYRMFQQNATFVEMLEDINLAITKLKEKAEADGIEIDKIALMGASAGGHLSLLYAYTHYETSPLPIAFVVGQVAPVDFLDPNFGETLGDHQLSLISYLTGVQIINENFSEHEDIIKAASPYYHVTPDVPPTILCYGFKDTLVPYSNGVNLDAKLTEMGVEHTFLTYPNSGHGLENDKDVSERFLEVLMEYAARFC